MRRIAAVLVVAGLAVVGSAAAGRADGTGPGAVPHTPGDDRAPVSDAALVNTAPLVGQAFYLSAHGSIYQRSFSGFDWGAARDIGGHAVDAPAASGGPGGIWLAVEGTDGAVWIRHGTPGGSGEWDWGGWQTLGGRAGGAPSLAITSSDGDLVVIVAGTDRAVWGRARAADGTWTGWSSFGGTVIDRPALTAQGEIYATGSNGAVYAWTNRSGAPHWVSLGGSTFAGPGAAHPVDGTPNGWVVVAGRSGSTYAKGCSFEQCDGGSPFWRDLGGEALGGPAVSTALPPSNATDIAVRGEDHALYLETYTNAGFSTWHKAWTPTS